jgi:hypothetical protein
VHHSLDGITVVALEQGEHSAAIRAELRAETTEASA